VIALGAGLLIPFMATTRSGIPGRHTTARSRGRCSLAMTGSAFGGSGRLVLEQASSRYVDAGDRDGDAWHSLPARQDAHRSGHSADLASRVGSSCTVVLLTLLDRTCSTRALRSQSAPCAFLGSLVLATMPDWYMIAHQTMTDMPCVARSPDVWASSPRASHTQRQHRAVYE